MKKCTIIFCFFTLFITGIYAQNVVSVTYEGSKTKSEIISIFSFPFIKSGADYYKMRYTSVDAKGALDTLSGLLVIPTDTTIVYPVLVYEHGTAQCKTCVPSRYGAPEGDEGKVGVLFSGMNYVALLPDYVGMGDGRGFQAYVQKGTSVSASDDMLKAFRSWAATNHVVTNNQLFITGYSQGGYAAMVFHQYMQATYGANAVTAAAHNSGPYSLSGVMHDLFLVDSVYGYPAYIPNTVLGLNEVYGFYTDLNQVFEPPFVQDIQSYYDGAITLSTLNDRIKDSLIANYGDAVAYHMINDSIRNEIANNPNFIINQILRDNDAYKWTPKSPTRIFYCKADDQVPYKNSVVAIDSMYARGADPNMVKAIDLDSTLNHGGCVTPAFTQTILFFGNYQSTTAGVSSLVKTTFHIYPNPAKDKIYIKGNSLEQVKVSIWNMSGEKVVTKTLVSQQNEVDVSQLKRGIYIVQLTTKNGGVDHQKLVIE